MTCGAALAVSLGLGLAGGAVADQTAPGAFPEGLRLPSGQQVTFQDVLWGGEAAARVVRFRFVAPAIARDLGEVEFSQVEGDMVYLCETFALPRLAGVDIPPAQIIISLADRPVLFGQSDPGVTQYFEAYRPDHGSCIWEGF